MFDFPSQAALWHTLFITLIAFLSTMFLIITFFAVRTTKSIVPARLRWATVSLFAGFAALSIWRFWYFWTYKPEFISDSLLAIDIFRFITFMFYWWAWTTARPILHIPK
jgi:ABC-type amino acid transport system permease subunit